jgi:Family of unknown function (DUF6228)
MGSCLRRPSGAPACVDVVVAGRDAEGLQFSDVERGPDGEIWYVWARLRVTGMDASLRVSADYAVGFDDLVSFFRGMADSWRGWQGARQYVSLERDLVLTATHDGHVRLAVQLRLEATLSDGWSAAAVIRLDPGEEMTVVAEQLADLLSPPAS